MSRIEQLHHPWMKFLCENIPVVTTLYEFASSIALHINTMAGIMMGNEPY